MNNKIILLAFVAVVSASAQAGDYYTINESNASLYKVDVTTGNTSFVGALGVNADFGDLAYDSATSTMYMTDGWGSAGVGSISNLYKVNLNTGAASLVGSLGEKDVFGLAFDGSGNLFGGQSTTSTGFMKVDKNSGATSVLSSNTGISLDGLTYVGSTKQMVGCFAGPGSFYEVNTSDGSMNLISNGAGFVNNCGIAWDPTKNVIYAVDYSGVLYTYDVANNYALVGTMNLDGPYDGLAYAGVVPEPTTMIAATIGIAALLRKRRK